MTSAFHDPASVAGRTLMPDETADLLVVGAGPAGLAAGLEAARRGLRVILADENPVPLEIMGGDLPLHFGQRMTGAVRNRNAALAHLAATDPAIADAFEAGIDMRLGTAVWGIYTNGASVGWLPGPVAALTDGARTLTVACRHVIVAAGRRDMGLAFPGWELPGVMGMTAAVALATKYGALAARRAVVLGSTPEALAGARQLSAAGIEITAVVEIRDAPIARTELDVLCGHEVVRAEGGPAGVHTLVLRAPGGKERSIDCDTIILGVGAVPLIELLDAAGCRTAYSTERGGYVPVLGPGMRTSNPAILAAGDCAGIWPEKSADPSIARVEGGLAACTAAGETLPGEIPQATSGYDIGAYRLDWVRSAVVESGSEAYVCQCEEVTAREIMELRPPRYLGWPDERRNLRELTSLLGTAVPNPDQVKRLTRAGMGVCQGRRCREQVAALLALAGGVPPEAVPLASYRAPVRPLPLEVAAAIDEPASMAAHWDVWFGMAAQYVPHWDVKPQYTAAGRGAQDKTE